MENTCRVCAKSDGELIDIASKLNEHELSTADMLILCVDGNLHLNDPFPKKICQPCAVATQNAFALKRNYEKSHRHFCELLNVINIGLDRVYEETTNAEISIKNEYSLEAEEDNTETETETIGTESMEVLKFEEEETQLLETNVCDEESQSLPDANKDLQTDELEELAHRCKTCGSKFPNKTKLLLHSVDHIVLREFQCPHCSRIYSSRKRLEYHIVFHSEERHFPCPHCPMAFHHEVTLLHHLFSHPNSPGFKCPQCDKKFRRYDKLQKHLRSHNRFRCELCPKTFGSDVLLRNHKLIHSTDRPFACPHCPHRFLKKHLLQNHIEVHLNGRQFKCNECQQTFIAEYLLKSHKRFYCKVSKKVHEKSHSIRTRFDTRSSKLK